MVDVKTASRLHVTIPGKVIIAWKLMSMQVVIPAWYSGDIAGEVESMTSLPAPALVSAVDLHNSICQLLVGTGNHVEDLLHTTGLSRREGTRSPCWCLVMPCKSGQT